MELTNPQVRIGAVPSHWTVERLRHLSDMRVSNVDKHVRDDELPVKLCNYVDVYKNDRIHSGIDFMSATATVEEIERFRLHKTDVLITKDSEDWKDIGVPALVDGVDEDVVCGYHLALLRPHTDRIHGAYLFRALQCQPIAWQFHVRANGVTRYGLSHSGIKSIWLPVPPLTEQADIARFLDYADERIQRYIGATKELIGAGGATSTVGLFQEYRARLIADVVTGKLDVGESAAGLLREVETLEAKCA